MNQVGGDIHDLSISAVIIQEGFDIAAANKENIFIYMIRNGHTTKDWLPGICLN